MNKQQINHRYGDKKIDEIVIFEAVKSFSL